LECEILKNGTRVYIDDTIRFGCDALILSRFAITARSGRVLDLGCGCGILSLAAIDRGQGDGFTLVDIDERAVLLAKKGVSDYRANQTHPKPVEVINEDLKTFSVPRKFDTIVCNPPYFSAKSGKLSRDILTRTARHELHCTIADVAYAAHRNLKQGGSLCISYRPARLADALTAMRNNRLEPKKLRFVRRDPVTEPWLVLIQARLDGGVGLEVQPDLIVQGDIGGLSAEMLSIIG